MGIRKQLGGINEKTGEKSGKWEAKVLDGIPTQTLSSLAPCSWHVGCERPSCTF